MTKYFALAQFNTKLVPPFLFPRLYANEQEATEDSRKYPGTRVVEVYIPSQKEKN